MVMGEGAYTVATCTYSLVCVSWGGGGRGKRRAF